MESISLFLVGIVVGLVTFRLASSTLSRVAAALRESTDQSVTLAGMIREHFKPLALEEINITERRFPFRMRADLQRTLDSLFDGDMQVHKFVGVHKEFAMGGVSFSNCIVDFDNNPAVPVPPEYEELNIDNALNEMLFAGGNLNLSILGANQTPQPVCAQPENCNTKE